MMSPTFVRRATAACIVMFGCGLLAAAGRAQSPGEEELKRRIAALEVGQKAILKELEQIKMLLQQAQTRPAVPTPVPPPSAAQGQPDAAMPNLTGPPAFDIDVAGAPSKGRPDAKLVFVEFSDFQCPFCGRYTRDTFADIEREYVDTGKIRYVFRHFPLERLHPLALRASEAAECANQQGKFWQMHTRLFANQQALAEADLARSAEAIGLNMVSFGQCMTSQAAAPTRIRKDQNEGARAGISGTPTFFIGRLTSAGKVHVLKRFVGAKPLADFKAALDPLLTSPDAAK